MKINNNYLFFRFFVFVVHFWTWKKKSEKTRYSGHHFSRLVRF